MSKPVLYFLSGNPCIYGIYTGFFELLEPYFHVVLLCFPQTVPPEEYTEWLMRLPIFGGEPEVYQEGAGAESGDAVNRDLFPGFCDVVDAQGRYHALSGSENSGNGNQAFGERFFPGNSYLLCHSYGSWHGVRMHERLRFRQVCLVGPFLMQGDDAVSTNRTLDYCSTWLVKTAALGAFSVLNTLLPDFGSGKTEEENNGESDASLVSTAAASDVSSGNPDSRSSSHSKASKGSKTASRRGSGLWARMFSIDKAHLDHSLGDQVFQIVQWEQRTIATILNFSKRYRFKPTGDSEKEVVKKEPVKKSGDSEPLVEIDSETTFLLYPMKPRDAWCHRSIWEGWPDQSKRELQVCHGFCCEQEDTRIVADTVIELLTPT